MYLFFDNVPSNPTAEILKLKLQSPFYPVQPGAAQTEIGHKVLLFVLRLVGVLGRPWVWSVRHGAAFIRHRAVRIVFLCIDIFVGLTTK